MPPYPLASPLPRFRSPKVEFGQGLDQLTAQVRTLKETHVRLTTQVADLQRQLAQTGGLSQQIAQLQAQVKTLTTERDTARTALAPTQKEVADLKAALDQTQSALSDANQAREQANNGWKAATQRANDLADQIGGFRQAATAAAASLTSEKTRADGLASQLASANWRAASAETAVTALRNQINGMVPRGELDNAQAALTALQAGSVPKGDYDRVVADASLLRNQVGQAQSLQQTYNRLVAEVRGIANLNPPADGFKTEGGLTDAIWGTLMDAKRRLDQAKADSEAFNARIGKLENFANQIADLLKEE